MCAGVVDIETATLVKIVVILNCLILDYLVKHKVLCTVL